MIHELPAVDLAGWRADELRAAPLLVDVREPWEYAFCRIDGSMSIPLGELQARQAELPRDRPLVLVCHHGQRSRYAAMLLAGAGFAQLHNLQGGVEGWAAEIEPAMKRY